MIIVFCGLFVLLFCVYVTPGMGRYLLLDSENVKAKGVKFSTLEKNCEVLDCQSRDVLEYKK